MHINPDHYLETEKGRILSPERNQKAWRQCFLALQEALSSKTIEQKIKEIFDSNTYIYKADVEITTKDTKMTKRLIGKNGKYLITMDNELIPIEEITDIKNKND